VALASSPAWAAGPRYAAAATFGRRAPAARFAGIVVKAMTLARRRTKVPLMAPTAPTFAPPVRYMGAQVSTYSHGGAYSVTLLATGMPLPVNRP
jgi:hypothetical protein